MGPPNVIVGQVLTLQFGMEGRYAQGVNERPDILLVAQHGFEEIAHDPDTLRHCFQVDSEGSSGFFRTPGRSA